MSIQLACVAAHPLAPNLRPGNTVTFFMQGRDLMVATRADSAFMAVILTLVRDGALVGETGVPDLITALRELAAPARLMAG